MPRLSIVIPNYNGEAYLKACLKSLLRQSLADIEIIVVDDGSTDGSAQRAEAEFSGLRFIYHEENLGFAASVNDGIAAASAEYVILLNNDTVADKHFAEALLQEIQKSDAIFSVAALMLKLHEPEYVDSAGDAFSSLGWAFSPGRDKPRAEYAKRREVFSACAGAAIYRKDALLKLGGFDTEHFAYLEDVDIGFRAKWAGYKNYYAPGAKVLHAGSGSSGSRYNEFKLKLTVRNQIYLVYKNFSLWMLILNAPQLFTGWLIKLAFFTHKGMGFKYLSATAEGFMLCVGKRQKRTDFSRIPQRRQLAMEAELLRGSMERFM